MKRKTFWILCAVWLLAVLGLIAYKVSGIAYFVIEWKMIAAVARLSAIPIAVFAIGFLFNLFKKQSAYKRILKILYSVAAAAVSLACFFLILISGVYSSTESTDHYLIPDRDIQLEPEILAVFPKDIQELQSCRYRYVRGKNPFFWDGNGWRIVLSASYDPERYASEVERLHALGLNPVQSSFENVDAFSVTKPYKDGVRVKVLFSEQTRTIIYYACELDLARYSEAEILSEAVDGNV